MRKKIIVFLFSLFLIVFLSDEGITETDMISNNITNVINIDEHSDKQHDLIYRNYGLNYQAIQILKFLNLIYV